MASCETVDDVIRRIIHILDAAGIPYMLTGIIRTQGQDLDTAYIEHWAEKLGLRAQWDLAKTKAG